MFRIKEAEAAQLVGELKQKIAHLEVQVSTVYICNTFVVEFTAIFHLTQCNILHQREMHQQLCGCLSY